jgi:hypothetical protein
MRRHVGGESAASVPWGFVTMVEKKRLRVGEPVADSPLADRSIWPTSAAPRTYRDAARAIRQASAAL